MERRKSLRLSELRKTLPGVVGAVCVVFQRGTCHVIAGVREVSKDCDHHTAGPVVCNWACQTLRCGASRVQYGCIKP
jgi:hypothetical protein